MAGLSISGKSDDPQWSSRSFNHCKRFQI